MPVQSFSSLIHQSNTKSNQRQINDNKTSSIKGGSRLKSDWGTRVLKRRGGGPGECSPGKFSVIRTSKTPFPAFLTVLYQCMNESKPEYFSIELLICP